MEKETSCRTCLKPTNKSNCEKLSKLISFDLGCELKKKVTISQMFQFCFSPMKLDNTDLTMICQRCLATLRISYSFKQMCLQTEKKLNCDTQSNKDNSKNNMAESRGNLQGNVEQDIKNNIKNNKKKRFLVYRRRFKNDNCYGCKNQLLDVLFHCSTPELNKNCICLKCERVFDGVPEIRKHMHTHNLQVNAICNICGKKHRDSYQLGRHLLSHTKERPHVCPICNQHFASQYIRNIHLQKHRDKEFLTCNTCKKQFSTKYNLNVHIKSVENSSRPVCLICHKKCVTQKSLDEHTCFKKDPYLMCNICGKYLSTKHSLQLHLIAHNPTRPTCTHCKTWFYTEKQLNSHLLSCQSQETEPREQSNVKEEEKQSEFLPDLVEVKEEDIDKSFDDKVDISLFNETNYEQDDYFMEEASIKTEIKNDKAESSASGEEMIDVEF